MNCSLLCFNIILINRKKILFLKMLEINIYIMKHVICAICLAIIVLFLGAVILVFANWDKYTLAIFVNAFIAYLVGRNFYDYSKKHWK